MSLGWTSDPAHGWLLVTEEQMKESGIKAATFSPLDTTNRALIVEHLPFLAQCARFYGLNSVACNTFEHDGIEMPEDIDARVREIMDNL